MALKVVWMPTAEVKFQKIVDYLIENWTEKEIFNLIQQTELTIELISNFPKLFRKSKKRNIYEAVITKHNMMIYQINNGQIEILTFFDTRQNPRKKYKLID